ncbi:hypothetical protein ACU4HD_43915 [Cupriavidus basilensis]
MDVPVINLIDVTSRAMVEHGGDRPAVIATAGTVKSGAYQNRVAELTNGDITPQAVAAHKFADFVNDLKHKSDDPAVKAELQAASDKYVEELDPNTTSLWLCCTHYPAMKDFLVTSLQKRGMDIPVVDPMGVPGQSAAQRNREERMAHAERGVFHRPVRGYLGQDRARERIGAEPDGAPQCARAARAQVRPRQDAGRHHPAEPAHGAHAHQQRRDGDVQPRHGAH